MILRPYQQTFVQNIRLLLGQNKHIIACSATGSGKTITFLSIAKTATDKGTTVVIMTESRKIFNQIIASRGIQIKAGVKHIWIEQGKLYVAMAQTLAKRPFIIGQLQALKQKLFIINDEAHVGTATKLLAQLRDAYLIGFTATPDYRVAKHLPLLYKGIVIGPQPQELVEGGYLAPYYHYEKKVADLSGLKKDSKGEFTEASQAVAFEQPRVFAGLHSDLDKQTYKKCLIFCSSIKHATALTEELRANNYTCAEVHSQNKNSDTELATFMHGQTPICVSVGVLTKGFDMPAIDLVVLQRATTSLALYCQMVGRGSRTATGKTRFTVLDYGGNASRHGLWNFEHDWATMWMNGPDKKKKEGVAPVKECPKCFLLVAARATICPECGHTWEQREIEMAEGELIDITEEYNSIRGKMIADLTPNELAIYARNTNKKAFAIRVAKGLGREYLTHFATAMKYHPYWVQRQDLTEKIDFYNIRIR
jgi:superfamily II DNA or RNA helicase